MYKPCGYDEYLSDCYYDKKFNTNVVEAMRFVEEMENVSIYKPKYTMIDKVIGHIKWRMLLCRREFLMWWRGR